VHERTPHLVREARDLAAADAVTVRYAVQTGFAVGVGAAGVAVGTLPGPGDYALVCQAERMYLVVIHEYPTVPLVLYSAD